MSGQKTYYLTTPIYYVNDAPHIGHAYTTLACDVLARFKRLDGYEVYFLTGTDEHGQKVEKSAEAAGVDPQEFTDKVSQNFRELADFMNYSHDGFIRTTEARHTTASQAIWKALQENGHIYLGSYKGWYAVRDEAFYAEDELNGNVIVAYSDILFESAVVSRLLRSDSDIAIVVDIDWRAYYVGRNQHPFEEAEKVIFNTDNEVV